MSLRAYLFGLSLSSILCWFAWLLTVVNTNPAQGGQGALLSFYISLFFGLVSTASLLGYFGRVYLGNNEIKYAHIRVSFRQAFLIALLATSMLLLQAIRLLVWWDILLLLGMAILIELYARSYDRSL